MILGIFITSLVLILPLFFTFKGLITIENKEIFINVFLFKFLKITNIKLKLYNGQIHIKIGKIFSKNINLKAIFKLRNNIKKLRDYHILSFNNYLDIDSNNLLNSLALSNVLNLIFNNVAFIIKIKKTYIKLNNIINIHENNNNSISNYFKALIVFNILTLIISLLKYFGGKFINELRKQ